MMMTVQMMTSVIAIMTMTMRMLKLRIESGNAIAPSDLCQGGNVQMCGRWGSHP